MNSHHLLASSSDGGECIFDNASFSNIRNHRTSNTLIAYSPSKVDFHGVFVRTTKIIFQQWSSLTLRLSHPNIILQSDRLVLDRNGIVNRRKTSCLSSSRGVLLARSRGGGGGLLGLLSRVEGVILLAGAVDGDLDSDLTTLNLLGVHLLDGLLLLLLGAEGDETEATALTALVASLELLDHETRNGTQGDLGRDGLVGVEELFELWGVSS